MARVSTHGQMARCTRVSGVVASRKAKVSGRASMGTRISASGVSRKPPDMACTCGKMATGTKESGRIALNMVKDQISSPMETVLQEHTTWENQRDKASTNGKT